MQRAPQSHSMQSYGAVFNMHYIVTFMLVCVFVPARTGNSEGRAGGYHSELEPWNKSSAAKSVSQFLMVFGGNSGQLGEASICRIST